MTSKSINPLIPYRCDINIKYVALSTITNFCLLERVIYVVYLPCCTRASTNHLPCWRASRCISLERITLSLSGTNEWEWGPTDESIEVGGKAAELPPASYQNIELQGLWFLLIRSSNPCYMSILGKTRYSNLDHLKQNIQVFSLGHKSFTYVRTPALLESYDQNRTFTARKLYDQTKRPSFDDKPSYTLLTYTHDMPDCQCAVKHNNGLQGRQTRQQNEQCL